MSIDDLGTAAQLCNTLMLACVLGELRTIMRRQRRIADRVGVVEGHVGITPPVDPSGPRPSIKG